MGEIRKITCQNCHKNWEVFIGMGMRDNRIDHVIRAFPEERQDLLRQKAEQNGPSDWNYLVYPGVCRSCGKVVSIPVLQLTGIGWTEIAPCPDCGNARPSVSRELSQTACPNCGETMLKGETTGYWD